MTQSNSQFLTNSNTDKAQKLKVGYLPAVPFFLLFGGGETQLLNPYYVIKSGNIVDINLIDLFDKNADYDVIHFFGLHYSHYRFMKLAKEKGIKIALSPVSYATKNILFGSIFHRLNRIFKLPTTQWLHRECLKMSDIILPNSNAEQEYLESYFNLKLPNSQVVFNAISTDFYKDVDFEFEKLYSLSNYILCVGKIEPRKNQLLLAKLLSNTDYQVVFIGDKMLDDINYFLEFQKVVQLSSNIHHFTSFPQNSNLFKSAYKSAKVHVLLGENETPGLVSIEAAVGGCNIVVHDCKPVREYFGNSAFYCNIRNNKSILDAIDLAFKCENDNEFSLHLSNAYNWDKVALDYIEIYKSICR